jgi:hypothetical protein
MLGTPATGGRFPPIFHGLENVSMPMAQGFCRDVFQFPGVTASFSADKRIS